MSRIGKKIIRGLQEFNDSLKRGEDVTKKFTWRRPGESVRAFFPFTPNSTNSVTFRK